LAAVEGKMKLSEAIQEAIRLSEASRKYWERELPNRHPDYPLIRAHEDPGPSPPEDAELEALLRKLSEEQIYTLILLMYIGRGDCPADQLAKSYQSMKETFQEPELAISQMTGKLALDEYLQDGLAELSKRSIDVDSLGLAHATSANPS
jgi:hypothetical protein